MADVLPPGSVIGILGGGQLGRMTAIAAAEMGYRAIVMHTEAECPAAHVSAETVVGDFTDEAVLDAFADKIDVATLEWENVPVAALEHLAQRVPVRPGAEALKVCQDRWLEKTFLDEAGLPTCAFHKVDGAGDLETALHTTGGAGILKTRRFGYDGKGQVRLSAPEEAAEALDAIADAPAILEAVVPFDKEISVVVARGAAGAIAPYVPVENVHKKHILDTTTAPAPVSRKVADRALEIAAAAAERLGIVGLLAIEMFVTPDEEVLVNEMAPRPHNSGHWTIDACLVSQFEQLVRAVAGLPLGDPERHSDAVMTNLIGEDADNWPALFAEPGARLHLYGKRETRPGRKMGHVTRLTPKTD